MLNGNIKVMEPSAFSGLKQSEQHLPVGREQLRAKPLIERAREEKDSKLRKQLQVAAGVAELVRSSGGRALVVGGFARDEALRLMVARGEPLPWLVEGDIRSKDIDLEVYGIADFSELMSIAAQFGDVDLRGEQFSVLNVCGVDFALPRRDFQEGPGHQGFTAKADPFMTFGEAFRRRDFTVNAIAIDPTTGAFFDECGGLTDLKEGVLRVVDSKTFPEDPVRPLRGAQLVARFGFRVDPQTAEVCRQVALHELPTGRVGEEWNKLLRAPRPGLGLKAMLDLGVLDQLHPQLRAIADDPQKWEHLCSSVDTAVALADMQGLTKYPKRDFVAGALCLFLGVESARTFLTQLDVPRARARTIIPMVEAYSHLKEVESLNDEVVRRLAVKLYPASVEEFCGVLMAVEVQRPELPYALLAKATTLGVERRPPVPLISGTSIMEMGVPQGREVGRILNDVYEAQLRGEVRTGEQAIALAREVWERGK